MDEIKLCDNIDPPCVIPKRVMQTWKCKDIPDKWKKSQPSIRKYMPDWEYTLMTDEDNLAFVKHHFPEYLDIYLSFPYPIQRADCIRYMYLYIHGGIYMDLDYEVLEPLDHLFNYD